MTPVEIAQKVIKRIETSLKVIENNSTVRVDNQLYLVFFNQRVSIELNDVKIGCFAGDSKLTGDMFKQEKQAYDEIKAAIHKRRELDKQNALSLL
jgi:hypothetical protein